jgi:hypothetical protein
MGTFFYSASVFLPVAQILKISYDRRLAGAGESILIGECTIDEELTEYMCVPLTASHGNRDVRSTAL